MRDAVIDQLLALNKQFYQTFALEFAATRERLQPGVVRALNTFPPDASVLDMGCGIGELANELADRSHHGIYLGLDSSSNLISIARERCRYSNAQFQLVDFADPSWTEIIKILTKGPRKGLFDRVLAFAVLHHIPSHALRGRFIQDIVDHLAPNGQFWHSNWNFMISTRFRDRIVPWRDVGIDDDDIEEGDYLLDWRRGGYGLRYVHHFDEAELHELADATGFHIIETFYSDGEGGRLGLYQVWERDE
jgi:2-polyprenyl-3-methyl-5-hydroxy-6-metoxy-1,4-benzoquinol methylase